MNITDIFYDIIRQMGNIAGKTTNALTFFPGKKKEVKKKTEQKPPQLISQESIRAAVREELARFLNQKGGEGEGHLEERLEIMAKSILALQKKIEELSAHRPLNDALISQALNSLELDEILNDQERSVLTSVFKENIQLQKPEMVNMQG